MVCIYQTTLRLGLYPHVRYDRNCFTRMCSGISLDTLWADQSVLIREVTLFQGVKF